MNKFLVNPGEFIHDIIDDFLPDDVLDRDYSETYDVMESELFNLNLYPVGHKVFISEHTTKHTRMSDKLKNGILKFLETNKIEEFYLDENE